MWALSRTASPRALARSSPLGRGFRTTPRLLASEKTHDSLQPDPLPSEPPSLDTDPYPIPLQNPDHQSAHPSLAQRAHPVLPPKELGHPEGRPTELEDDETMRRRLVWLSRKRGIVEMELLLSTFVKGGTLATMERAELEEYDRMLTLPDWDIYYYAIRRRDPPSDSEWADSVVLGKLRRHAANEGKTVRKMPDLEQLGPGTT